MKDKWYSFGGFKFTKSQIKWALANIVALRNGQWPPSHKTSGYAGDTHNKRLNTEGNFVKAASIAAELDVRIQRAGVDGLMMEFLYAFEPDDEIFVIEHMAQCLNLSRREVTQRIRNALYFVSGAGRKSTTYGKYVHDHWSYLRLK